MSMQATDPFEEIRILKSQRDALAEAIQDMSDKAWATFGTDANAVCDIARAVLAALEEKP